MEHNNGNEKRMSDSVYSTKFRAGKRRTYFFDVRATRGNDYYITLTESTKRADGDGYERHKIFLYKEDFNEFLSMLTQTIDHVKQDLMPQYDYDEFGRRRAEAQKEWEARKTMDGGEGGSYESSTDHGDVDKW
ncbi:MAG: DUF3276 family protein [Chitinophagales bacterium]|nr:DUF3276 family protein [Chitinophagales bacterium]